MRLTIRSTVLGLLAVVASVPVQLGATEPAPVVAIIVDDLGDRLDAGERALALPGPLTYAFLPHTPYTTALAKLAHDRGNEVMLHLPMESVVGRRLGPGGLRLDMGAGRLLDALRTSLDAVPHVRGVNNHMGSLLTRHPGHMDWLMQALRCYGNLYFVDSRTTSASVAEMVAAENGVPHAHRDIFLDHDRDPVAIAAQLAALVARAKTTGTAIGIGHPYPETLAVLEAHLPDIVAEGIELVPVSAIIKRQQKAGNRPWQASLSH